MIASFDFRIWKVSEKMFRFGILLRECPNVEIFLGVNPFSKNDRFLITLAEDFDSFCSATLVFGKREELIAIELKLKESSLEVWPVEGVVFGRRSVVWLPFLGT